ncbi:MAG: trigger factor [Candidatus Aminicenantales bacterium]
MKSTVKELNGCRREIEVEVDTDETRKEWEKILGQYATKVNIPGFRPGKAPKDIVKRMFYREIKEAFLNSVAPKVLEKEIKSQNLQPIGVPVISEYHFKEGEPFRLKAQLDIWPDIRLPEYKKIKVKKRNISVTVKEVSKTLEELQLKAAQYMPVEDRGVSEGDYVIAELKGRDTQTNRFFPTEKIIIIAGDKSNEPVLNRSLIGLKPEESCDFVISYEKNHQNKKLAGKTIAYHLKVISIKERKIPEINDDLAKDLGEYESLKDLKKKIRENLIASKEKELRKEMAQEIMDHISEKSPFELPETLIEQEYTAIMRRLMSSQPQKDLTEEEVEKFKHEGREKAEQNIRNHIILKKIIEEEGIKVTEEEVQEELRAIAKANEMPLARVVEAFNREGKREELKETLLLRKAVDFLVDNAIIE